MNSKLFKIYLLALYIIIPAIIFSQNPKIGDESDGSRAIPVHQIKLIDQDSSIIRPDENPLLPFSTEKTCGACHDYQKIRTGWHFNAGDSATVDGRAGQSWIFKDAHSGTQIPLSHRNWEGVLHPEDIGMDNLEFITRFGRQMPGGGVGDNENAHSLENYMRWQVSGNLEINCLSCHDAEKTHNQVEYATQINRQSFRWAATASSAFAYVDGTAKDLPDNFDIYAGIDPDQSQTIAPQVSYEEWRFNKKSEVFFDIVRKAPNERCYFCHSTKLVDENNKERWHSEEDVHVNAGMLCVDCHRNGLDHKMVRGYEVNSPQAATLTCAGCHIPENDKNGKPLNGRLGSPVPEHKGLPLIHFEKLACTTCHSSSWPKEENFLAKTSMAHSLGLHSSNKSDKALPHIATPVFAKRDDGKYAPHNLLWPSYWAEIKNDTINPLKMDVFLPITRQIIAHLDSLGTDNWPQIEDSTLIMALDSLAKSGLVENQPAYISGGKVWLLNKDRLLFSKEHKAADPYLWPIAHDVRPAVQSLGVNGCNDCHSPTSNFAFGDINIDSPVKSINAKIGMNIFLDQNIVYENVFASTFYVRPVLKYVLLFSALLISAVILIYGLKGLARILLFVSSSGMNKDKSS